MHTILGAFKVDIRPMGSKVLKFYSGGQYTIGTMSYSILRSHRFKVVQHKAKRTNLFSTPYSQFYDTADI